MDMDKYVICRDYQGRTPMSCEPSNLSLAHPHRDVRNEPRLAFGLSHTERKEVFSQDPKTLFSWPGGHPLPLFGAGCSRFFCGPERRLVISRSALTDPMNRWGEQWAEGREDLLTIQAMEDVRAGRHEPIDDLL